MRNHKYNHSEYQEQKAVIEWRNIMCKIYPELKWLHASLNGAYLSGNWPIIIKAKNAGMTKGVLDLFLPVCKSGYVGLYIEMKTGKNKLTPEQEEFKDFVEGQGYKTAACYSSTEAIEIISNYLGIKEM